MPYSSLNCSSFATIENKIDRKLGKETKKNSVDGSILNQKPAQPPMVDHDLGSPDNLLNMLDLDHDINIEKSKSKSREKIKSSSSNSSRGKKSKSLSKIGQKSKATSIHESFGEKSASDIEENDLISNYSEAILTENRSV